MGPPDSTVTLAFTSPPHDPHPDLATPRPADSHIDSDFRPKSLYPPCTLVGRKRLLQYALARAVPLRWNRVRGSGVRSSRLEPRVSLCWLSFRFLPQGSTESFNSIPTYE